MSWKIGTYPDSHSGRKTFGSKIIQPEDLTDELQVRTYNSLYSNRVWVLRIFWRGSKKSLRKLKHCGLWKLIQAFGVELEQLKRGWLLLQARYSPGRRRKSCRFPLRRSTCWRSHSRIRCFNLERCYKRRFWQNCWYPSHCCISNLFIYFRNSPLWLLSLVPQEKRKPDAEDEHRRIAEL